MRRAPQSVLSRIQRMAVAALWWGASLGLGAAPSQAADLEIFETFAGTFPGSFLFLPSPTTNRMVELEYRPQLSEGGGFYGFSEVRIVATGDVVFESAGFDCELQSCLFAPSPFLGGQTLVLTGADDLQGEFGNITPLVRVAISGTTGYVVVESGDYMDATGPNALTGVARSVAPRILVQVPEPALGVGLAVGVIALARSRRRLS